LASADYRTAAGEGARPPASAKVEASVSAGPSPPRARSVWRRFARSRLAVAGGVILGLLVLGAVLAPWLARQDPFEQTPLDRLSPPGGKFLLGSDHLGRDILSRILYGGRISLAVGLVAVAIGASVGTTLGLVGAFYAGLVDTVIMRCMDVLLAFPGILLALAVIAALGPGLLNTMVAVGVWSIPLYARIVRSSALAVRQQDFVTAAIALGATDWRLLLRHLLPNAAAPLLVLSSLRMASAILTAAGLSFLGLGVQPPTPEWGAMLNDGRQYIMQSPHIATFPGLAIMLTVLSLNFIGDGLRDALDPRLGV
jgi:peptide/nickel transport system permease protein